MKQILIFTALFLISFCAFPQDSRLKDYPPVTGIDDSLYFGTQAESGGVRNWKRITGATLKNVIGEYAKSLVYNDEAIYSYTRASISFDGSEITLGDGWLYVLYKDGTLKSYLHTSNAYNLSSGGRLVYNRAANALAVRTNAELEDDDAVLLVWDAITGVSAGLLYHQVASGEILGGSWINYSEEAVYAYTRAPISVNNTDISIGSNYIYILYKDGTLKSHLHSDSTYTLASGGRLVYNRTLSTLVIKTNAQLSSDDAVLFVYDAVKAGVSAGLLYPQYIYETLSNQTSTGGGTSIPYYVLNELLDVVEDTKNVQDSAINPLTFGMITDIHAGQYSQGYVHNEWFAELHKYGICDFLVNGGDIGLDVAATNNRAAAIALMDSIAQPFSTTKEVVFYMHGNHDDNKAGGDISEDDYITKDEYYTRMIRPSDRIHSFKKPEIKSTYYFKDFPKQKIRAIVLDTHDGAYPSNMAAIGITDTQLDWLSGIALDFSSKGSDKTNWAVVLFTHAALRLDIGGWQSFPSSNNYNHAIEIIKAFMGGSTYTDTSGSGYYATSINADFTNQGSMEVIASFSGHAHYDNYYKPADEWMYIIVGGAVSNAPNDELPDSGDAQIYTRTAGTITATLFDVVTIDRDSGKIFMKRFGAGVDREITYNASPSSPVYTIQQKVLVPLPIPFTSADSGKSFTIFHADKTLEIDSIIAGTKDSSGVVNFQRASNMFSGAGTNLFTSNQTISSQEGAWITPDNPTIYEGEYLRILIADANGDDDEQLFLQIYYHYRE